MTTSTNDDFRRIVQGNPDVACALLVDGDGGVHASEGASPDVVQAATAFLVPLRELLERATTELGGGLLRGTLVEGEAGLFALADVDGFRTVVVVGGREAAGGSLRADALWLAERARTQSS